MIHQRGIALGADAQAGCGGIKLKAEGFGEIGIAVG